MASGSIDGLTVDIVDGSISRRVRAREIFERPAMNGHGDRDLGLMGEVKTLQCVHWTTTPSSFLDSLSEKVGKRPVTITLSRGDSGSNQHILAVRPEAVQRVEKNGSLTYMVSFSVTVRKL